MATANSRDAVVEIHELANSASYNGANDRPPSYSSIASSFQPWYKAPKRVITCSKRVMTCSFTSCAVVTIAVCLIAISFNMLLFAGHAIHAVRNSPLGSDVGDDPEWPEKIDRSFHVWIVCMASITFVQAALTLFTIRFTTLETEKPLVFQIVSYALLHFAYYVMFMFDDVSGDYPVTDPNGIPNGIIQVIPDLVLNFGRRYPTIISWTCMKKDNQGDSSVNYDSICHTSLTAKYLTIAVTVFYVAACITLAFCLCARISR